VWLTWPTLWGGAAVPLQGAPLLSPRFTPAASNHNVHVLSWPYTCQNLSHFTIALGMQSDSSYRVKEGEVMQSTFDKQHIDVRTFRTGATPSRKEKTFRIVDC
jgi:hypothetical protein